jgi:hypothetical protein
MVSYPLIPVSVLAACDSTPLVLLSLPYALGSVDIVLHSQRWVEALQGWVQLPLPRRPPQCLPPPWPQRLPRTCARQPPADLWPTYEVLSGVAWRSVAGEVPGLLLLLHWVAFDVDVDVDVTVDAPVFVVESAEWLVEEPEWEAAESTEAERDAGADACAAVASSGAAGVAGVVGVVGAADVEAAEAP